MDLDPRAIENMFRDLGNGSHEWIVNDCVLFNDIVPVADTMEHWMGDECWCKPKTEFVPDGLPDTMFIHNASDGRE